MFLVSDDEDHLCSWQAPGGDRVRRLMSVDAITQGSRLIPLTGKPCRGLVLLRCVSSLWHYVCNPSTGELLPVPDCRIAEVGEHCVSYGLGYIPATREYKIVRLLCCCDNGVPVATRCEVFVLGASTCWRPSAGGKPPIYNVARGKAAVFFNGKLHFSGSGGSIVTFDVANQTFGLLMHPCDIPVTASPRVSELGGYLYVSHGMHFSDEPQEPFTMWKLKDYEAARWEKLCCIDQSAWPDAAKTWMTPVEIIYEPGSRREKKIMFKSGTGKVFAVDLDVDGGARPEILLPPENVPAMGGSTDFVPRLMGMYEESLVSVGRTVEEIIFSSPVSTAWAEVLKRLPTRSAARLAAVCRDWRAVIGTACFARSHTAHVKLRGKPRIMFVDASTVKFAALEDVVAGVAPPPLVSQGSKFTCTSSCHGLVICGNATKGYFLCNPCATGGYRKLQVEFDDEASLASMDGQDADTFFHGSIGLGYDGETSNHIAVCLFYNRRDYQMECIVRDAQLGGPWFATDEPPASSAEAGGKRAARLRQRQAVLEGPPRSHVMSIVEIRDTLCAACSCLSSGTLELWTMKDDHSWSLQFEIDLDRFSPEYSPETAVPLAVDGSDGRILLSTGRSLGYYDPGTGEMETIYSLGAPRDQHDDDKFVKQKHTEKGH
ncbi:hypothetical protein E2562_030856 [Oryza meyeriana var. granulata]|uniref:Uncharacterized protein n=1 Tax=Oryza meyeriana var. granulata TaxID=110450 RepID=A0A6G1F043_9ORYZ|nr:hypothetical protein E2562_030856 [Oryza meyeriana var. granulata]